MNEMYIKAFVGKAVKYAPLVFTVVTTVFTGIAGIKDGERLERAYNDIDALKETVNKMNQAK